MHGTGEPRLKVLVCIAYYGVENEAYVEQVIDEYRSMDYDVHIVVLTERWKSIDGVEQIVGLPCSDPYSLPFAHKPIFRDRADDYDLFVYTEDDTLVRQCNIEAFLWATSVLPSDRVAGFLRTEVAPDGTRRCSSVHNHFHWDPTSALRADGEVFAEYTNPHGACYVLTREQLRVCLDSGRFMSAPHLGRYSMRVTAATDPYTVCGLRKVTCVSRLDLFMLPHLTNKYTDLLGAPFTQLEMEAAALAATLDGEVPTDQLIQGTTALTSSKWDKKYHEPVLSVVIDEVPAEASTVLSVGCGSGLTEAALVERGCSVTAIPLDAVIGTVAASRGIEVTAPSFEVAFDSLAGRRFDAAILSNILPFIDDPVALLRQVGGVLADGGVLIVTTPNFRRDQVRQLAGRRDLELPTSLADSGVAALTPADLKRWIAAAGFAESRVRYSDQVTGVRSLVSPISAGGVVVVARKALRRSARSTRVGRQPLVSLGVPVFNGERHLGASIAALRAQTFGDLEIIISDNGSTDATEAICRDAAAADDRIRYVRHDVNRGAAFNYNYVFFASRGTYFAWTAHDDLRHPRNVERCLAEFQSAPGSVVVSATQALFIDDMGAVIRHDTDHNVYEGDRPHRRLGSMLATVNRVNNLFGLIRADVLERTGLIGPFEAADYVLLAELALHGEVRVVPEQLFSRRLHDGASRAAQVSRADVAHWFDVSAKAPVLSPRQRLMIEYFRAVDRARLPPGERLVASAMIPMHMEARSLRNRGGRLKQRVRAARR